MSKSKSLTGVYKQLLQHRGSGSAIESLIREIQSQSKKAKSEINLNGNKADQLLSIRRACGLKLCEESRVYTLLNEIEEHGHQTIFFYKPKPSIKDLIGSGPAVGDRLFNDAWGPDYFPRLQRTKNTLQWVDFRERLPGRPRDWLLKAYGHERQEETVSRDEKRLSRNRVEYTRVTEVNEVNTVMIVRWRSVPGWIEIRIHKFHANQTGVEDRLSAVKTLLKPLLDVQSDLVHYSFASSIDTMLKQRNSTAAKAKAGKKDCLKYEIGTVNVRDPSRGVVRFLPEKPGECIDKEPGRTASLKSLLDKGGKPLGIGVKWYNTDDAPESIPDGLITHVQGDLTNALSIQKTISSETYEYVLNQLNSYS